ncbi:MAG: HNH endonuclease [Bacteroidota bacterium]
MKNIFGTSNPSLSQCLAFWLASVKKVAYPTKKTVSASSKLIALKAIKKRIDEIYKQAGVPLTQRLGNFCSYCEIPLHGLVEVEHIVPKSHYPAFSTDWYNFLMSCGPCNNKKWNNPDRSTVKAWIKKANPTEKDYKKEIRKKHYIWPDINSSSYRDLPCELWFNDPSGKGWKKKGTWEAADFRNHVVSMSIPDRTVKAAIYSKSSVMNVNVEVRISTLNSTTSRGTEMINLCGLNIPGDSSSTYDRRLINRTLAWFTITMAAGLLENVTTKAEFDLMWPLVLSHAQSTGFYSVWVTILDTYVTNWNKNMKLSTLFVNDSDQPLYFPNTDKSEVP